MLLPNYIVFPKEVSCDINNKNVVLKKYCFFFGIVALIVVGLVVGFAISGKENVDPSSPSSPTEEDVVVTAPPTSVAISSPAPTLTEEDVQNMQSHFSSLACFPWFDLKSCSKSAIWSWH